MKIKSNTANEVLYQIIGGIYNKDKHYILVYLFQVNIMDGYRV